MSTLLLVVKKEWIGFTELKNEGEKQQYTKHELHRFKWPISCHLVHSSYCATRTFISFQNIPMIPKWKSHTYSVSPISPPLSPGRHQSVFWLPGFMYSGPFYVETCNMCLNSLTWQNIFKVHPCCNVSVFDTLWLRLFGCVDAPPLVYPLGTWFWFYFGCLGRTPLWRLVCQCVNAYVQFL